MSMIQVELETKRKNTFTSVSIMDFNLLYCLSSPSREWNSSEKMI